MDDFISSIRVQKQSTNTVALIKVNIYISGSVKTYNIYIKYFIAIKERERECLITLLGAELCHLVTLNWRSTVRIL